MAERTPMEDDVLGAFTGVKVFSATTSRDRDQLGEQVTRWLADSKVAVVDKVVSQSSDNAFHCLSIVLFYAV